MGVILFFVQNAIYIHRGNSTRKAAFCGEVGAHLKTAATHQAPGRLIPCFMGIFCQISIAFQPKLYLFHVFKQIFCANSNRPLAEAICQRLGIPMGDSEVKTFADGEVSVSINETVRGCDVFVIQSTCKPVNDSLMELLILIDALRRASAARITAVIPYFGYARQDRKAKARDPISAKLVANLITTAGADRVLTMDLHASQIQGFFDIPVDNLLGNPVFVKYYLDKFPEDVRENMVVVSPDVGSVARARAFATKVGMSLAIVDKRRQKVM